MLLIRSDISCRQIWITQIKIPAPPKVAAPVILLAARHALAGLNGDGNILAQRCVKNHSSCSKGADTLLCHPNFRDNMSKYFKLFLYAKARIQSYHFTTCKAQPASVLY